jgi:hypothetical protein
MATSVKSDMQLPSHTARTHPVTARANPLTRHPPCPVSSLSRSVTADSRLRCHTARMTNPDFSVDRANLERLVASGRAAEADAFLSSLHTKYHDRPGDHIRVHLAWMRVHFGRRAYARALGHAFAGLVVAGPSSLVQRYTGVVVPAFDARRNHP